MSSKMSLEPLSNLQFKVNALDNILDCPICYEKLSEVILQCTNGHSVCKNCQIKISKCPLCSSKFYGSRNYLVESIIKKFEDIKSALKNLNSNNLLSTGTIRSLPIVQAEKFPCGIPDCNKTLTYNDMISHIKVDHKKILVDVGSLNSNKHFIPWSVEYEFGTWWHRIVYIQNMGIFFIEADISNRGNVYGSVTKVSNIHDAQFYYELEADAGYHEYGICFKGPVLSTTIPQKKGKYLNVADVVYEFHDDDYFDLSLEIIRVH